LSRIQFPRGNSRIFHAFFTIFGAFVTNFFKVFEGIRQKPHEKLGVEPVHKQVIEFEIDPFPLMPTSYRQGDRSKSAHSLWGCNLHAEIC